MEKVKRIMCYIMQFISKKKKGRKQIDENEKKPKTSVMRIKFMQNCTSHY